MRNLVRISAALSACLTLGFTACGDDEETPSGNDTTQTSTPTDATSGGDGTVGTDATAGTDGDATTANPCDPNPCTTAPSAECDGNSVVTYAAPGTCTPGTGTNFTCDYAETTAACTGTDVCSNGACIPAGDKCDYTFDQKVSYVTHIALGGSTKDANGTVLDQCCFDFNDDDKIDNKLGSTLGALGDFVDVNGSIKEQIDAGELVLLLETKGVDSLTTDDDVDIAGFYGEDADTDLTNNAAGTSHFTVNPASFVENTMLPLISFPNAKIAAGKLSAGPSIFNLSIPIAGAKLEVAVTNTRLEGVVSAGANGQGLKMDGGTESEYGAKLGGVVKMRDLFTALNTYVGSCECLTFATTMITVNESTKKASCATPATDTCTADDGACDQIPGYCGTLLVLLTPDIDLDGDDKANNVDDGVSVGVWVKAQSATIDGVNECAGE